MMERAVRAARAAGSACGWLTVVASTAIVVFAAAWALAVWTDFSFSLSYVLLLASITMLVAAVRLW